MEFRQKARPLALVAFLTALITTCVMVGRLVGAEGESPPEAERSAWTERLQQLRADIGRAMSRHDSRHHDSRHHDSRHHDSRHHDSHHHDSAHGDSGGVDPDARAYDRASRRADLEVFAKGIEWALRNQETLSSEDLALCEWAHGAARARLHQAGAVEEAQQPNEGVSVRGYVSAIDGSVQPYGLIVPESYDPRMPMRLDVVLHGSSRPSGVSELRFMQRFDGAAPRDSQAQAAPFVELHPLGRVENCYRWAGESDVFEAIEDVCRRLAIDRRKIILRGMSMGASGTWHLGLKHPDRFVALGPYCGYVDTHRFSETPLPNFVKVGPLPDHQEAGLHMLDSVDYAANAAMVPAIACMGEKDIFFDAHVLMGEAMQREGLTMVNLISPGTGHQIDPVVHAEQMRRIAEHAVAGAPDSPPRVRFVTWTLKYADCFWVRLLGLEKHYQRAEIDVRRDRDDIVVDKIQNIVKFALQTGAMDHRPMRLKIDGQTMEIPERLRDAPSIVVGRDQGAWKILGSLDDITPTGKAPGMQGPIDDAFTSPFLCVRGTGTPRHALAEKYAKAALARFADDWQRYFRGDLPVKNDHEVTPEDLATKNLILFGDPGSNRWIAEALPRLPIRWTSDEIAAGPHRYSSENHVPVLVAPSPFSSNERRYVVLNSGHTFHGAELGKINYLLFPRWGDWGVMRVDGAPTPSAVQALEDHVQAVGYFNEAWEFDAPSTP